MTLKTKESAIEVKVGVLVLFSLALLGGFITLLGDLGFDEVQKVYVDYKDIAGLKPGAVVKQGGIDVGRVRGIEFMNGEKNPDTGETIWARIELEIENRRFSALRSSSQFFITTEGVLGEKFIRINTERLEDDEVEPGHIFRGVDPQRLDELVAKVSNSLDSLNKVLQIEDLPLEQVLRNIDQLVVHTDEILMENRGQLHSLLGNADQLVTNADGTISENRETVRSLLTNTDALVSDGRVVLENVTRLSRQLDRDFGPLVARLSSALSSAEALLASWRSITDDAGPKVGSLLDDAAVTMDHLKTSSEQVAEVTDFVSSGRGSIGMLIRDEELFDNIREMLRELKRRPWKLVWKE
ncbi:MAG: hypothetical protein CO108_06500 [Deltaproteobacteria bacterium CG_4_9_14_3_um_filter_63_12]|nr:MAG: hypothetical protein CO108_06500 [Deltaproteobacteria bacterium CG_4_9_14_3_um_filter_63_12]